MSHYPALWLCAALSVVTADLSYFAGNLSHFTGKTSQFDGVFVPLRGEFVLFGVTGWLAHAEIRGRKTFKTL
jgi:hypothetical protein